MQWLLWGQASRLRAKDLDATLARVLGSSPKPDDGSPTDTPFVLTEKEMRRLCGATR